MACPRHVAAADDAVWHRWTDRHHRFPKYVVRSRIVAGIFPGTVLVLPDVRRHRESRTKRMVGAHGPRIALHLHRAHFALSKSHGLRHSKSALAGGAHETSDQRLRLP